MLLLKHFITEVLEYKADLKGRIKFVCVAMCSLVISLCACDLHVTSLNNNYYNTLNTSRLTVVQLTQHLVFGWYNINLFYMYVTSETKLAILVSRKAKIKSSTQGLSVLFTHNCS